MSKQELIDKLKELLDLSKKDPEDAHGQADEYLLKFINDSEITDLFNKLEKWYA